MKVVSDTHTLVTRDKNKDTDHAPGVEVDLPKAAAEAVVARGLARRPGKSPKPSAPTKPTGAALDAAIAAVILDLDPQEDVNRDGTPSVPALEKHLGYDITAAERDAAWDAFVAAKEAESKSTAGKPAET